MVRTFAIVNVTRDSFSDGGRFLAPGEALAHAERLLAAGADVIDVGAESTHPDAEAVPAATEIERLQPVVNALLARGATVSVDTCKPEVMQAMGRLGVHWFNDVDGFRSDAALAVAAAAPPRVQFVVMFHRGKGPRAERNELGIDGLLSDLEAFVAERKAAFARAGIAPSRLVFDPGMGFFLGASPAPSLHVLRHLPRLIATCHPQWLVSVSRKSFVGAISGAAIGERGPGSLAAELWAARCGVAFVRTHDPGALRMAWAVERAIAASP